jgi:hypothetical protein
MNKGNSMELHRKNIGKTQRKQEESIGKAYPKHGGSTRTHLKNDTKNG